MANNPSPGRAKYPRVLTGYLKQDVTNLTVEFLVGRCGYKKIYQHVGYTDRVVRTDFSYIYSLKGPYIAQETPSGVYIEIFHKNLLQRYFYSILVERH